MNPKKNKMVGAPMWAVAIVVLSSAVGLSACSDDEEDDAIEAQETHLRCGEEPPEWVEEAPELRAYSEGQCPTLEPGFNTIESSGHERQFKLIVPEDWDGETALPTIVMWHWLQGRADSFAERGQIQKAANQVGFMAIIPDARDDLPFQWPFTTTDDEERIMEEVMFFDDMMACANEFAEVDRQCITSTGISAGALWTSQLVQHRSDVLANFVALSGGVGPSEDTDLDALDELPSGPESNFTEAIKPWEGAEHKIPGVVLWGGSEDTCFINFEVTSQLLQIGLEDDGHFFLECIHNCAHTKPPTNPPEGEAPMAAFWEFALDHPRWVMEGTSPYQYEGVRSDLPQWCGIGMNGADIRTTDDCGDPDC